MISIIGILNEKSSQAENFSKALGGISGCFNGENYKIAHARGHLYGFPKNPDELVNESLKPKYKGWDIRNLPWDENDFHWKYIKLEDTGKTLSEIKKTLTGCDEICIATDDDPTGEGELLAWEIISQLNLKASKYSRMYFEDETPKSIQKAFKNRKILGYSIDCMNDDPDYKQAIFRTKWDYLSMQWTRVATGINHQQNQVLRTGRLKAAMVKIVGDQLEEVKNYVKKPFYQNRFKDENGNVYVSDEEKKYDKSDDVPFEYSQSEVICDSKKIMTTSPPKFLDLATMSAILEEKGYKSKQILTTYQKMYEDHVVSYPRTEDHYITEEQFNELLPKAYLIAQVVNINENLLSHTTPRKTHIKSGMTHGANRPGPNVPISLDELDEKYGYGAKAIYDLLARNYLATLCEDYEYEHQEGHLKRYPQFKGTANIPAKMGWKAIYNPDGEDGKKDKCLGTVASPFIYEGANPKPKQPTMKWLMKKLEKRNVGTGATRTSIFADVTNQRTKYPLLIDKKGKLSFATCGEAVYKLLPDTHIGDLSMTEHVMDEMNQIKNGTFNESDGLHEIQRMIREDVHVMMKNVGISELPTMIKNSNNQNKDDKVSGIWEEKNKSISIKKKWGSHIFSNDEIKSLFEGKEISFSYNGKVIAGKLEEQTYNGHKFVGFKMKNNIENENKNVSSDKVSGIWKKTNSRVSFKRKWGSHTFTDDEIKNLFENKKIKFEYNGKMITGTLKEQTYNGHKFIGFKSERG